MIVRARGRLKHGFHGEYRATIALVLSSAEEARNVLAVLGRSWGPGRHPETVVGVLTSEEIEDFKARYAPLADPCEYPARMCSAKGKRRGCVARIVRHDIDGVDHSVDVGPAFSVDIVCPAYVPDEQAGLPWQG